MGCLFGKPKTDIWNDEVQGFDNLAIDEKEVSGRTSQTFDIKRRQIDVGGIPAKIAGSG